MISKDKFNSLKKKIILLFIHIDLISIIKLIKNVI